MIRALCSSASSALRTVLRGRVRTGGALAAMVALLWAPVAAAHPFHVSVAEMERDQESGRVEVALRCWPEDLEAALFETTGEPVNIEDDPAAVDPLIARYLNQRILIAPPGDEPPPPDWRPPPPPASANPESEEETPPRILWVGKELERRHLWLYFEIRLPDEITALRNAWISNRLFLDTVPQQDNVMRIRDGDFQTTVRTDAELLWTRIEENR